MKIIVRDKGFSGYIIEVRDEANVVFDRWHYRTARGARKRVERLLEEGHTIEDAQYNKIAIA